MSDQQTRRQLLMKTLFGAGWLGLRSLATGIPLSILANPRAALAAGRREAQSNAATASAQFVILATSGDGDPLGANAPGSYVNAGVGHPTDPSMARTALTLNSQRFDAARPWSTLPQALLDRSCFFHHTTNTVVHPDQPDVMGLKGVVQNHEMFPSLLAAQLAPALETVQAHPIVLGPRQTSEVLTVAGQPEPILSPSSLAALLSPPQGPLGTLTQLRDADLDRLNALVRSHGNARKNNFIDQYALTQRQARQLSLDLLSTMATITDDSPDSQVKAAITLIRMKATPLVSVHIPFGGDNHLDRGLYDETTQTVSGVRTLANLYSQLVQAQLQDQVSFLSFNVFGRTLKAGTTSNGRDHNGEHNVSLMFGSPFRGGVVGGIESVGDDLGAMSLSSSTGAGVSSGGGNIARADTMLSMAATFGLGVGVPSDVVAANTRSIPAVASVLTGSPSPG